jgi:hypothetical protein
VLISKSAHPIVGRVRDNREFFNPEVLEWWNYVISLLPVILHIPNNKEIIKFKAFSTCLNTIEI